jgi:TfoX/Sxy family transcriptional regulator of competence genes
MAYNLDLAKRIAAELQGLPFIEKKMFGGVGFLLNGNMACGVIGDGLIVRVNTDEHAALLKPMKGWLVVEAEGCKTSMELNAWIKKGVEFSLTLPPK